MILLVVQYVILIGLVIFASIRISECMVEFDYRHKLVRTVTLSFLLCVITALPELITSFSALVLVNNPDLAFGAILGGNALNLFVLALLNIFFMKHQLFKHAGVGTKRTTLLSLVGYVIVFMSWVSVQNIHIGHVGVTSILLIFLYGISLKVNYSDVKVEIRSTFYRHAAVKPPMGSLVISFSFWSIVTIISSLLLTLVANEIAQKTGIGSSFVGAFYLGIAMALPELTTLISLVKFKNYDLVIGSVIGSNLFNFLIIAGIDLFYFSGNIFQIVDMSSQGLIGVGLVQTLIVIILLVLKPNRSYRLSFLMIGMYVYSLFFLLK